MSRLIFAAVALLLAASGGSAEDLPNGTWRVNVAGKKGELLIAEVAKDGKVKAKFLGADVTGTWKDGVLTLDAAGVLEGRLVTEPAEKGQTKYTLTGTYTQELGSADILNPKVYTTKTGWYAQITADTPPPLGQIKVEVKGVLVVINSPGGSPVQAGQIHDEIRRLRAQHPDKPTYAVV